MRTVNIVLQYLCTTRDRNQVAVRLLLLLLLSHRFMRPRCTALLFDLFPRIIGAPAYCCSRSFGGVLYTRTRCAVLSGHTLTTLLVFIRLRFFFSFFCSVLLLLFVLFWFRVFFFFFTFRQTVKAVNRPVANGLVVVAVPRPRGRVVRALSDPGGLNRTNKLQCISSNVIPVLRIATIL